MALVSKQNVKQMANPEHVEEPQIKIEEPTADEQQPQEVIVEEITHTISPQTSTSPLPPTVITTQRHRMITTAGHIREVTDTQQEPETTETYENSSDYVQMAPQVTDTTTYIYEHPGGAGTPIASTTSDPTAGTAVHILKRPDSRERDRIVAVDTAGVVVGEGGSVTTAYVEQTVEESEVLRYSNAQVRYEEEAAAYHSRYEYHHTPQHQHQQQQQQQHATDHTDEIKVRAHHQQQDIHIYEHTNDGNRQDSQVHVEQQPQQQTDAKTQYTNLEPAVPPQSYYIADGYQTPGGYTYLPHAGSKDFPVFHSASPNTVLYKDPTLTSALTNRQYGPHQALYDNGPGPSDSPVQQVYTTYCKQETPSYWSPGPPLEYNVHSQFNQAIILDNSCQGSAEYVANGHQWSMPLPEPFDPQSLPSTEFKECANCSTSQSPFWRSNENGHNLCNTCSYSRQTTMTRQPNRSQKAKQPTATGNRRTGVICANCKTSATTLWRRNNQGEPVCNACGLYYKLHTVNRPQSMKKEGIQTRKRKPKSTIAVSQGGKIGIGDKILPPIFPSQIHAVQPEIKISNLQQPHNMSQPQDMHVGSSQQQQQLHQQQQQQQQQQHTSNKEHYINIPPQSQSPHLPNPSNLSRHISAAVPPIDGVHTVSGKIASVITSTGTPE